MTIDEVLEPVLDILRSAYPAGYLERDYLPLLVVLSEGLGEENLGKVIAEFVGVDEYIAIHDSVNAVTVKRPDAAEIERVRELLVRNGWNPDDD